MDISAKWKSILSEKEEDEYRAIRISASCIPDLFLAIDKDGLRCLLLYLPRELKIDFRKVDKDKISSSLISSKGIVVVKLKDLDYKDLFDDLILSIYSKISLISDPKAAFDRFLNIFFKWVLFFEVSKERVLSKDQIKGLYGELFVLSRFLEDANPSNINYILESWKGPYDGPKDFEFDDKEIEVKTKKLSKSTVKISSEYQLEKEDDKDLELLVVSVVANLVDGKSLFDLSIKIRSLVLNNLGSLDIFFDALAQKKLSLELLKQYNNTRLVVSKLESFNAGHNEFPKLTRLNVFDEISEVSYELKLSQLNKFLIQSKEP